MAISLNTVNSTVTNHETRIKALESKGTSSWTKGSNSNGYWVKETTTGLIIQWGNWSQINGTIRALPISFSDTNYTLLVTIYHELYAEVGCRKLSKSTFDAHSNANWYSHGWIAIGIAKTLYYKVLESINRFFKEVIS